MGDWVTSLANRFSLEISRLYIVADPDRLLEVSELSDAVQSRGFDILVYEDPVEFRFLYEDEVRPQLLSRQTSSNGVIIVASGRSLTSIPYDVLSEGRAESFDIGSIAPRLDANALRDVPRDHLDRIVRAYEQTDAATKAFPLTESETRSFLIRDVYRVPVSTVGTTAEFVAYLTARHYNGDVLPESIDRHLAKQFSRLIPARQDGFELLHDRDKFFNWLQVEWSDYISVLSGRTVSEERVPFNYAPIRVYVDNLFAEGLLERIDVVDIELPQWTRSGIRRPGDDPVREANTLIAHLSDAVPEIGSRHQQWVDFAWRWGQLRYCLGTIEWLDPELSAEAERLQSSIEDRFAVWLESRFGSLTTLPAATQPVVVSHIASVLRRRLSDDHRIALVVVDGMAIEHWINVLSTPVTPSDWSIEQGGCFAWIPTLTSISRQAIFAGRPPTLFADSWNTTSKEPAHWKRVGSDAGLTNEAAHFVRVRLQEWGTDDTTTSIIPATLDLRLKLLAVVINDIDELSHANTLGFRQMHQSVGLWSSSGRFQTMIDDLLDLGFTVYVTSDHGSVEATGEGQPKEGELVEQRAMRARLYSDAVFADRVRGATAHSRIWPPIGLPDDVHVLVADGLTAFAPLRKRVVAHGGISIEEVIVPFVRIRRES